jgi:hypothetical protein
MQCSFIKPDKQQCGAKCLHGGKFCFFHDPKTRKAHKQAAIKGANTRNKDAVTPPPATLPPETPSAPLANGHDVRAFVAETLNQVRTGKLAVAVGNCLFVGAGVLLKAIEGSVVEDRITALEQKRSKAR